MEKLYTVASYIGDFPLDNQDRRLRKRYGKVRGHRFTDLQEAITAAQEQHQKMSVRDTNVYTMVLDYEAVETGGDDVLWLIHQDKIRIGEDAEAFANYLASRED
jgi:hypothetical protein